MNAKYPDGHTMSPIMSQTHVDLHTLPEFGEAMESLDYQTWTDYKLRDYEMNYEKSQSTPGTLTCCNMLINQLSHWLNIKGPLS